MKKNLSNMMQLLSLTIVLAFLAPVMVNAQSGKANFAGTWAMNAEKSTLPQGGGGGGGRGMGGGNFTVTQDANILTQTRTGQDGTARVTKYTLDGKESVNTFGNGGESKSTAKWSADGKTLTVVTKMNFNGNEVTSTAVWSLIDAKTLSIVSTRQGQNGEVKTTIVYDKK
jgi:Tol biopolymer transport system component